MRVTHAPCCTWLQPAPPGKTWRSPSSCRCTTRPIISARSSSAWSGSSPASTRATRWSCVDDGSSDASAKRLLEERLRNPAIELVCLSRNFGRELALTAGLDHAMGAAVVVIDPDQQDPPELIPELLAKSREGIDVVHARRASRQGDGAARKPGCSSRFED